MIDKATAGTPLYVVTGRGIVQRMLVEKIVPASHGHCPLYGMRPESEPGKRLDYRAAEQLFTTELGARLYAELLGKIHYVPKGAEGWAA